MSGRRWFWVSAVLLVLAAVSYFGYRHWCARSAFHDQFDQVGAGMSDEQVREVMEPPGDYRSDRRPQVSEYAEVWQMRDGEFAYREYRGMDVHTAVLLSGKRFSVWKRDEAVVIVEFDGEERVCGKIWLAGSAP
ncbi:MAG: hypothetical protein JWO38_17 [Gemmataceae bacterium]|nr:hypothetical protein [Gemmataceae bacterium]